MGSLDRFAPVAGAVQQTYEALSAVLDPGREPMAVTGLPLWSLVFVPNRMNMFRALFDGLSLA